MNLINRKYQEKIDDNQLTHQSIYFISLVQETRFEKKSYSGVFLEFDMLYEKSFHNALVLVNVMAFRENDVFPFKK